MYQFNWKKITVILTLVSTFFSACRAGDVVTQVPTDTVTITVKETEPAVEISEPTK